MKRSKPSKKKYFIPTFPEKCSQKFPVEMRSMWEWKFANWLDVNPSVVKWSFERKVIWYNDPIQNKRKRYIPDFWVKFKDNREFIIEIKPFSETIPPIKRGRKKAKTQLYQEATYKRNMAKWKSARSYAEKVGAEFRVITEKEMFFEK